MLISGKILKKMRVVQTGQSGATTICPLLPFVILDNKTYSYHFMLVTIAFPS